ncbi:hypothetical protein TTRE_0000418701 [Trichuris trichiura]|uniref:EGF-like domain-containing protein n=1 Tax=Trichuris trichiura TaxID=36087 RepID=A0A077Z8F1_TRITR|nr:hypothetical protein TTRE_0000418701 [Trichuris trichiura]
MTASSYMQMLYIFTIGAFIPLVVAEKSSRLLCPFEGDQNEFVGGYRKHVEHNYSQTVPCVTMIPKGDVTVDQSGVLSSYSKYCHQMEGRVAHFDNADGLPAESNWFSTKEVRLFSGHEVVDIVTKNWMVFPFDKAPFQPACAKHTDMQCVVAVYRISLLDDRIIRLNATNCFGVLAPDCTMSDPIVSNCSGSLQYCKIDQQVAYLPGCRVFVATVRGVYHLERFRFCLDQAWDYFACETRASDKWIYRKKVECTYDESTRTCYKYNCTETEIKSLYKCNWHEKIVCTCACAPDAQWSEWSVPSASCGVTMRVRYKPLMGQEISHCTQENSTVCCSESVQEVLLPCSEYHHGTNIEFKRKPCVNGLQVPHSQGGSRCECFQGYAGMLCEMELGGAAAKVRELSAIITSVIIVVCTVVLTLALSVFIKKWLYAYYDSLYPTEAGPEGALSELIGESRDGARQLLLLFFLLTLPELEIAWTTSCPHEDPKWDFLGYHIKDDFCMTFVPANMIIHHTWERSELYVIKASQYCDSLKQGKVYHFYDSSKLPTDTKWLGPFDYIDVFYGSSLLKPTDNITVHKNAEVRQGGATNDTECPETVSCYSSLLMEFFWIGDPKSWTFQLNDNHIVPFPNNVTAFNCIDVPEKCQYYHPMFKGCMANSSCFQELLNSKNGTFFCRAYRAKTRLTHEVFPLHDCSAKQTWKYFACEHYAYQNCRYKKIIGCHFNKQLSKCVTARYEIIAEAEPPFGRCEMEKPEECICECKTEHWQSWSQPSRTCDTAVRIRYGPKDGAKNKVCTATSNEHCCTEVMEESLTPCSEYHHGTNLEFKSLPCVNGIQVAHPKGGGRCECYSGFTGRSCELRKLAITKEDDTAVPVATGQLLWLARLWLLCQLTRQEQKLKNVLQPGRNEALINSSMLCDVWARENFIKRSQLLWLSQWCAK